MHQTSASVNAFHANRVALHFRPIFDSRPPETAEIRHFPSATAAKTVQLEPNPDFSVRRISTPFGRFAGRRTAATKRPSAIEDDDRLKAVFIVMGVRFGTCRKEAQ